MLSLRSNLYRRSTAVKAAFPAAGGHPELIARSPGPHTALHTAQQEDPLLRAPTFLSCSLLYKLETDDSLAIASAHLLETGVSPLISIPTLPRNTSFVS